MKLCGQFGYQLQLFNIEQFEIYPDGSFPFSPDGVVDFVVYPEFFWWRENNEAKVQVEPNNPIQTRCPRCFSVRVSTGYPYIKCLHCGYNEPLIDFPISSYYHLALEVGKGGMGENEKGD